MHYATMGMRANLTDMPSYRSILTIGALHAGRRPPELEVAVRAAVAPTAHVDGTDVSIVAGEPRFTVRFTAADDGEAREIHAMAMMAARQVVQVPRAAVAAVVRGKSVPLRP